MNGFSWVCITFLAVVGIAVYRFEGITLNKRIHLSIRMRGKKRVRFLIKSLNKDL